MTEDELEDALRTSLRTHADRAPLAGDVVAATLAAAQRGPISTPVRQRRGWRTWALPVLAAGTVGAVVAAVVGIQAASHDDAAPVTHLPSPSSSTRATTSAPAVVPAPVVTRTVTAAPKTSATRSVVLHDIRIGDLTFDGPDHGWALGSADCLRGAGRCSAVLRTTDGRTWQGIPGATFNVDGVHGCADPCISHLRFATDSIGYAYGPDALFMTTNGGASWQRQEGLAADALETADGNVVAVRTSNTDRPLFERASIGTSRWTSVGADATKAAESSQPVWLVRAAGRIAVVTPTRHWDPGFEVVRSRDNGVRWTPGSQACPDLGTARLALGAVAMSPDGTLFGSCSQYNSSGGRLHSAVLASTDGGATFGSRAAGASTPGLDLLAAASSTVLVGWDGSRVVRSADGGKTWTRVSQVSGQVIFVGFENEQTGRIVADGGRTIWTTHDAGRNWSKAVLS